LKRSIYAILGIPIVFNIGEFFNGKLPENSTNIEFIIIYLLAIIPVFFIYNEKQIDFNKPSKKFITKLLIFGLTCLMPFFYFIFKNVDFSSLLNIATFMEGYRNGAYKGSGIFTFLSTNIFPFIYCFILMTNKIKVRDQIFFGLIVVIPPLILGLRVWLIPIFIVYILIFFSKKNIKLIELILFFVLIIVILLSTKLILAADAYGVNILDTFFKILSRTNYQAILTLKMDLNVLDGFLSSLDFYSVKDYFYYKNQLHIESLYFNRISLTSGMAMPLPVLILNTFGKIIGTVFLSLIFIIWIISLNLFLKIKHSFFLKSIFFFTFIILTGAIIEDVTFLTKFILIPFLSVFILILEKIKNISFKLS